jgi:MFS family permease
MGMFFFGSIVGYICTGSMVDNYGRKLTFNFCLLIGAFGKLLVLISANLPVA